MRILVAEADPALGAFLEQGFRADSHAVDLAVDEEKVKSMTVARYYDAAILDLNLRQDQGLDVLREVRARRQQLPILILASRARPAERAQALDLGADDLVFKPFAFAELSARVRALLRRGGHQPDAVLRIEDLELRCVERSVTRAGRKIDLTPKEFALLEYLMRNRGLPVTRMQVIQHVWKLSFDTMTNVVDVYINYLRKKVDAASERKLIHTIRGVGYQMRTGAIRQERQANADENPLIEDHRSAD
ncbi:MAG TPA: response regulator transcription factor [Candidatus Acidoferrales bacterium]|nr:response regulator transcription factor [Candidatus Acidoferrales bacterium]